MNAIAEMVPLIVRGSLLVLSIALTGNASATTYDYTFSPDATVTFNNGDTEDISGYFTYDDQLGDETVGTITLTGPAPEASVYVGLKFGSDGSNIALYFGTNEDIVFDFQNLLSPASYDPLVDVHTDAPFPPYSTEFDGQVGTENVTGGVGLSVPEPASTHLLVAALSLLFVIRRPVRRLVSVAGRLLPLADNS